MYHMVHAEGGREQEGGTGSYAFLYLLLVTSKISIGPILEVTTGSLNTRIRSELREH